MVLSMIFGNKVCKSNHKHTFWPLIWIIFTLAQAILLRSYTNWVEDELKDLGIIGEQSASNQKQGTPDLSCTVEMPSEGFRTRQSSVCAGGINPDMSINSITTV